MALFENKKKSRRPPTATVSPPVSSRRLESTAMGRHTVRAATAATICVLCWYIAAKCYFNPHRPFAAYKFVDDVLQLSSSASLSDLPSPADPSADTLYCPDNPFWPAIEDPPNLIRDRIFKWLAKRQDIERELVAEGLGYTHARFGAFRSITTCKRTCVGGECGADESKMVCGLDLLKAPCVVYSVGGNNMWSFELDILANTECEVHTFDCTGPLSRFDVPQNSKLTFHHTCIVPASSWSNDGQMEGERLDLQTVQKRLGHQQIDLLKMDIEGFEWPILYDWLDNSSSQSRELVLPMQILLEIHFRTQMSDLSTDRRSDFKFATDMVQLQTQLLRKGYVTTNFDPNVACAHCLEVTLIRVKCESV
jgi:hypothetical protein